jgi:HK97 family phage major capsid protein
MNGMSERERALRDEIAANHDVMRSVMAKHDSGATLTVEDRKRFDDADEQLTRAKSELSELNNGSELASSRGSFGAPQSKEDRAFATYMATGNVNPYLESRTTDDGMSTAVGSLGYAVPQGFFQELTIALKDYSGFHQYYRQYSTPSGNPTMFPTNDPTQVLASQVDELHEDTDTTYAFGQGVLYAFAFSSGIIKASREIVMDNAFSTQEFVTARAAESIGRKMSALSASGAGSGSHEPVGLYNAIGAMGEFSSGGSGGWIAGASDATVVPILGNSDGVNETTGNLLVPTTVASLVKAVDPAYHNGAAWYMSNDQFVNMTQEADGFGRPLFPELRNTQPTLGGNFPVNIVQASTDIAASTVGGPVFGNLGKAMIRRYVDNAELATMQLTERYAEFREVAWITWVREDHQILDPRAVACIKGASS